MAQALAWYCLAFCKCASKTDVRDALARRIMSVFEVAHLLAVQYLTFAVAIPIFEHV